MKHRTGHLFKRGDAWYLRWTVNGKVFSRVLTDANGQAITTRKAADEKRVEVMQGFTVGDEVTALQSLVGKLAGKENDAAMIAERDNPPLTINEAWSAYVSSVNRRDSGPSTMEMYEAQLTRFRKWIDTEHGEVKALRSVTVELATDYAKHLQVLGVAASTYNQHVGFLSRLWRVLSEETKYKVGDNPWSKIKQKTLSKLSTRKELTLTQLGAVLTKAHGEMKLLFGLGIYTGLRLGDCATLRWSEVDLHRRLITRVPMKIARRDSTPVKIPLHPVLLAMLTKTNPKTRGEYILPESAAMYGKARCVLSSTIQEHFRKCGVRTIKAGTGLKATGKRAVVEVGFHSLRHTFVSLCRASDVPLSVVQSLVGHSSPSMTAHYTHVSVGDAALAVNCLPSIGGTPVKALPAVDPLTMLRDKVKALAEKLTAKNAATVKAELLAAVG